MSDSNNGRARAVADVTEGLILACVEVAAPPERVFQALASKEITEWWVRPGIFDTREWSGDVHAGGRWRAAGIARGQPYVQEGEYLEVDSPRRLVHTWELVGSAGGVSTVSYLVEPLGETTRVTLRHAGFHSRDMCRAFTVGWETSLERLAEVLRAA